MTLEEARGHYHRFHKFENGVYYMVDKHYGYNQTDYQFFRVFGKPGSREVIGAHLGAWPECGGATFSADPMDKDFGEIFAVKVWGCD